MFHRPQRRQPFGKAQPSIRCTNRGNRLKRTFFTAFIPSLWDSSGCRRCFGRWRPRGGGRFHGGHHLSHDQKLKRHRASTGAEVWINRRQSEVIYRGRPIDSVLSRESGPLRKDELLELSVTTHPSWNTLLWAAGNRLSRIARSKVGHYCFATLGRGSGGHRRD